MKNNIHGTKKHLDLGKTMLLLCDMITVFSELHLDVLHKSKAFLGTRCM